MALLVSRKKAFWRHERRRNSSNITFGRWTIFENLKLWDCFNLDHRSDIKSTQFILFWKKKPLGPSMYITSFYNFNEFSHWRFKSSAIFAFSLVLWRRFVKIKEKCHIVPSEPSPFVSSSSSTYAPQAISHPPNLSLSPMAQYKDSPLSPFFWRITLIWCSFLSQQRNGIGKFKYYLLDSRSKWIQMWHLWDTV